MPGLADSEDWGLGGGLDLHDDLKAERVKDGRPVFGAGIDKRGAVERPGYDLARDAELDGQIGSGKPCRTQPRIYKLLSGYRGGFGLHGFMIAGNSG